MNHILHRLKKRTFTTITEQQNSLHKRKHAKIKTYRCREKNMWPFGLGVINRIWMATLSAHSAQIHPNPICFRVACTFSWKTLWFWRCAFRPQLIKHVLHWSTFIIRKPWIVCTKAAGGHLRASFQSCGMLLRSFASIWFHAEDVNASVWFCLNAKTPGRLTTRLFRVCRGVS